MVQIIPAILSTNEEDFQRDVKRYNNSSFQEGWVHIDFMDNEFVPNRSITPDIISKYPIILKKEAHLMVKHFHKWVCQAKDVKFDRIIFHYEADGERQLRDELWYLEDHDIESGFAINPGTEVEKIKPFINDLNLVMVMGVEPGFQGQSFIEDTYERVKKIKELLGKSEYSPKISVDGGVNDENARKLVDAGVDYLVVGSFLLKGDINDNYQKILQAIKG